MTSFIGLLITYGIIFGAGIGFGYVFPIAAAGKCFPDKKGLIGVVTDTKIKTERPVFGFEQVKQIADLIEVYIKRQGPKRNVRLFVNEKAIFIKPFIKDFFLKTISAMVDSLRGTQKAQRIQILIDKPQGEPEDK